MKIDQRLITLHVFLLLAFASCQTSPKQQVENHEPALMHEFEAIIKGLDVPNILVGQWITPSHDKLYFSPTDQYGRGAYVLEQAQHTENSRVIPTRRFIHLYKVYQYYEDGRTIDIIYAFETGKMRFSRYILSENGKYMTNQTLIGKLEIETVLKKVNDDFHPHPED